MSYILALDTASDYCSVAIVKADHPDKPLVEGDIAELRRQAPRQHTQMLLPMVDELLKQEGISKEALSSIAFGVGPGSFTGLRICFAVVQGLAYGLQIPVLPTSTLAAMATASNSIQKNTATAGKALILSCLDARMGQVYWGCYSAEGQKFRALQNDSLDDPQMAKEKMLALIEEKEADTALYCCGPGWHYPELADVLSLSCWQDMSIEPWAQDIAALSLEPWRSNKAQDIREVQPVYLRNEISWEKRKRIRQS